MKCHSDPMIIFFRFLSCSKLKEIFSKPRVDLTLIFGAVHDLLKLSIRYKRICRGKQGWIRQQICLISDAFARNWQRS